jgi:hypothetical protein
MLQYPVTEMVRLTVRFSNTLTGSLQDPDDVTLALTPPDGTPRDLTIEKESTGIYHADLMVDQVGIWQYRWQGLGGVVAATPTGTFQGI